MPIVAPPCPSRRLELLVALTERKGLDYQFSTNGHNLATQIMQYDLPRGTVGHRSMNLSSHGPPWFERDSWCFGNLGFTVTPTRLVQVFTRAAHVHIFSERCSPFRTHALNDFHKGNLPSESCNRRLSSIVFPKSILGTSTYRFVERLPVSVLFLSIGVTLSRTSTSGCHLGQPVLVH